MVYHLHFCQNQDLLHNLWHPGKNEKEGCLVKKLSRISKWQQQIIKPSVRPIVQSPAGHREPALVKALICLYSYLPAPLIGSAMRLWITWGQVQHLCVTATNIMYIYTIYIILYTHTHSLSGNSPDKESGLDCAGVNDDAFTVLVSGGRRHHWTSRCTVLLLHSKWLSE